MKILLLNGIPSRILVLSALLLLFSFKQTVKIEQWHCDELKYTYQIVVKGRYKVSFPQSFCEDITQNRLTDKPNIIKYSDFVSVRVFSKQEIEVLDTTLNEIVYE